ncbi:MAG: hypothetical protein IPH45_11635 [Bacteroidales bacterium]|nr:hypothetical protein [Bacteroidales bacterium]
MKRILYLLLLTSFSLSGKVLMAQPPSLFADPGTSYCAGGTGVILGVLNSVNGTTYQLQQNTGSWVTITTISGNGGIVYFTGNRTAG